MKFYISVYTTPLAIAIEKGNIEIVKLLLSYPIDVNSRTILK